MSDSEEIPSDVKEAAASAVSSLIPGQSKRLYEDAYHRLNQLLCLEKKIKNEANEKPVGILFNDTSDDNLKRNIDISRYTQLIALLKRKSKGYKPKKASILTKEYVKKFLEGADDEKWLLTKVVLIIGFAGACRREELTNLLFENVKDEGNVFYVKITNRKTKILREFFLTSGNIEHLNLVEIVRKYIALRFADVKHEIFFLGYRNSKCTVQPVGINTIGNMPKNIASSLKLPNIEGYTGHSFRKSSTSLLANSEADLVTIKRHGGWRSSKVAKFYIEAYVENKKKVAVKILGEKI